MIFNFIIKIIKNGKREQAFDKILKQVQNDKISAATDKNLKNNKKIYKKG